MQPDDAALPAALFMESCAHWTAMQVLNDHAAPGGSPAPLSLLGQAALQAAFTAVLAASGWSTSALHAISGDLEAAWGAALDCGLMPSRVDELGDLVGAIGTAQVAPSGTVAPADMIAAVPIIGSLIIDVGEQFGSIGRGLG